MMFILLILAVLMLLLIARYIISYRQFEKKALGIWRTNSDVIVKEIESIGDIESESFICFQSKLVEKEENVIILPEQIDNPWQGKVLELNFPEHLDDGASENVVRVEMSDKKPPYTQIGFTQFHCIKAPRIQLKNGNYQNLYSASKFIQRSEKLKEIYSDFKGRKKYDALEIPLMSPIKIFGNPKWIQSPRFIQCPNCRHKMNLIAQISGHYLSKKADKIFGHGEIYIFSCKEHPEIFKSVIDIT